MDGEILDLGGLFGAEISDLVELISAKFRPKGGRSPKRRATVTDGANADGDRPGLFTLVH